MSSLSLMIKSADAAGLKADSSADVEAIRDICNHLQALASGNAKGTVYAQSAPADPVAASGTWTLDTVVATDTVTVGPITFTGTDTPTTNLHFDTSLATDALIAADIARAVNEHPVASTIVTASAASAVVTVTAKVRGVVGNWIAFTDGDSTITSSGSGYLAGGTGGVTDAEATYNFGE